eukprot:4298098-Pyramimonas_sp.AAC.1
MIKVCSGRVPYCSSCLLNALVHSCGGRPQMFVSLTGGGSHVPEGCSPVLGTAAYACLAKPWETYGAYADSGPTGWAWPGSAQ